jgi:hypothetical protein
MSLIDGHLECSLEPAEGKSDRPGTDPGPGRTASLAAAGEHPVDQPFDVGLGDRLEGLVSQLLAGGLQRVPVVRLGGLAAALARRQGRPLALAALAVVRWPNNSQDR